MTAPRLLDGEIQSMVLDAVQGELDAGDRFEEFGRLEMYAEDGDSPVRRFRLFERGVGGAIAVIDVEVRIVVNDSAL